MKTVEIEISRTEGIRVPISVPNHWDVTRIRRELTRPGQTILNEIADETLNRGWEWGCDGHIRVDVVYQFPEPSDAAPVFVFPDEAPPKPSIADQQSLPLS